MMAKNREDLKQFAKRRYDEVLGVRLQSLTDLEQSKIEALWGKRFNETGEPDLVMRRELLVLCIVDDNGDRIFGNDEVDLLEDWDGAVTGELYLACRDLCHMDIQVSSETLGKESGATTVSG